MNKMKEINSREENNQISIQEKCMELEAIVSANRYNLFENGSVVVAVPTLIESNGHIKKPDLKKHHEDALNIALYLTENKVNLIAIIKDVNVDLDGCLKLLEGRKLDYLICLYKFIDEEKNFIVQSLRDKTGSDLVVIELEK